MSKLGRKLDKVLIRDLSVRGILGINPWERENKQDIVINLVLFTDIREAGLSDSIDDCVNYFSVAQMVQQYAETAQRLTVEALATDIAKLCLEIKGVQHVRVRVEKPEAVQFAQSVGIEIERAAADFPSALP